MTKLFKSVLSVSKEEYEELAKTVQPLFTPISYPELVSKEEIRHQWVLERLPIRDAYGYTLLMYMVTHDKVTEIQKSFSLLSKDEKVNLLEQQDPDGRTALMIAIRNGYTEIVDIFLNAVRTDQKAAKRLLTEKYEQVYRPDGEVYRYNALSLTRAVHKQHGVRDMTDRFKSVLNVSDEEYEELAKTV